MTAALMQTITLPTAAWYGDRPLRLELPGGWRVEAHWPATPPPLSDSDLRECLERPVGQPPIRRLAEGKRRPLIIVDDLTRPTPAARVVPLVLEHLRAAGIPAQDVRIVLAKGAHGPIRPDCWEKKIGREAAGSCALHVHEYDRELVRAGRTSFGTPVLVNREVAASDLLIGIGGIYPQNTTGFGGGSKLVLGVLGRRSIVNLHYRHPSMNGSARIDNDFRRDLDEIAAMVGLRTMASIHVDAGREIVRMVSGDHLAYYRAAVEFACRTYAAPLPGDAQVVISNAYPMDVSLTFMRSKGINPLSRAAPFASRIVISCNSEGVGLHRIYPFLNGGRWHQQRQRARRLVLMPRREALRKIALRARRRPAAVETRQPVILYTAGQPVNGWPARCGLGTGAAGDELLTVDDWTGVLDRVRRQQRGQDQPRVVVYPCAPLQVLVDEESGSERRRPA